MRTLGLGLSPGRQRTLTILTPENTSIDNGFSSCFAADADNVSVMLRPREQKFGIDNSASASSIWPGSGLDLVNSASKNVPSNAK